MARLQAKFGETEARKIAAREARERRNAEQMEKLEADADPNLIPLGARLGVKGDAAATAASRAAAAARLPPVPDVEWWDAPLLADGTYDDVRDGAWNVAEDKMTLYVEHPVPMEPPVEDEAPPPQPLMLTKKEQKKLRTQRRRAREEEKQEMIRQGLMEAPKPKVKISNLMRVLTDEATADPTAVEREVREQMKERADAHEDRNLARMLTPAERKEKKMRKLFDDPNAGGETQVHVYRVESMSNPRNKFKVDINAQENHLTGASLENSLVGTRAPPRCRMFVFSRARLPRLMTTSRERLVLKASELSGDDREYSHHRGRGVSLARTRERRIESLPED